MRLRSLAVAAALALLPTLSAAAGNWYVSGFAGYTMAPEEDAGLLEDVSLEDSACGALAVGVERPIRDYARFRVEGEVSYRQSDFDEGQFLGLPVDVEGSVSTVAFLVNLAVDFETGTFVRPYLVAGGGAGWTKIDEMEVRGVTVSDDDLLQYACQIGGGVGLDLTPALALDLGYRYFATSRDEFEDELGDDFFFRYRTHNFLVGLRYRF